MSITSDPARQSYDSLASRYDRRWAGYIDATMRLTLEGLNLSGTERVLDLACGTGELVWRLLERWPGLQVVGTDISRNMLHQAQLKTTAAHFVESESDRLPFQSACFDLIVCANAFHYFRLPAAALAEMRRVLKPSGKLVLVDWCDDYLTCKLCSVWLRWTDPAFYRTYSLAACEGQIDPAGLTIESAMRQRVSWIWGMMRVVASEASE